MSLDNNLILVIILGEIFAFIVFMFWISFESLRIEASKNRDRLLSQYYDKVSVTAERIEDAKL